MKIHLLAWLLLAGAVVGITVLVRVVSYILTFRHGADVLLDIVFIVPILAVCYVVAFMITGEI